MTATRAGEIIAAARRRAKLSQHQLGQRTGYAQPTISRIERGRQQAHDVRILRRLAEELDIPLHALGLAPDTGEETWALEVLARVEASDTGTATLEGMHAVAHRLCCDYPSLPAPTLHARARKHLQATLALLDGRLTLAQHREVLVIAGWLALLAGCLEYDMGMLPAAEGTRRVASSLGRQAGHSEIVGWAHEMSAWFALTQGHYRRAVEAAQAGAATETVHSVAAQLAAQEAKGWARLGDHRQVAAALDRGAALLERTPRPDHPEHHFVIDPTKRDFYAMDCYRSIGDNEAAAAHAHEVLRIHTNADGSELAPMRMAEARITLGMVAGRHGDLDGAVHHGTAALGGQRRSLPSLTLYAGELAQELLTRYPSAQPARDYAEQVRSLRT